MRNNPRRQNTVWSLLFAIVCVAQISTSARALPALNGIDIEPLNASIQVGESLGFTATGTYSDGFEHSLMNAPVMAVATGVAHACALLASGQVQCWGDNFYTQFGNGTTTDSSTPVLVSDISTATAIAVGDDHSCVLLASGQVQCWGYNVNGQLGNGTTAYTLTPVLVSGISTATAITGGVRHSCAVLASGQVQCWGNNGSGMLGNGMTNNSTTPVNVIGITTATQIASGYSHSCAVLVSGQVQCWGSSYSGQLGTGYNESFYVPGAVIGTPGVSWTNSNPAVAALSLDGIATGLSSGSTLITATVDNFSADTQLFVNAPSYILSLITLGTGSGSVTGAGTYSSGSSAVVTATANADSTFIGWTGADDDAECASGSVLMNADKTCTATFTLNTAGNSGYRQPSANSPGRGGDGNGYEVNVASAYLLDGVSAADMDSGNSSSGSCTHRGKDSHNFYNYGFSIPTGADISGIEIRLRGHADSVAGTPKVCVQLSWDGGASWTAVAVSRLSAVLTNYKLGSSMDTWGHNWSAAEFSDANFRVRVINSSRSATTDFYLDGIDVRVTY